MQIYIKHLQNIMQIKKRHSRLYFTKAQVHNIDLWGGSESYSRHSHNIKVELENIGQCRTFQKIPNEFLDPVNAFYFIRIL